MELKSSQKGFTILELMIAIAVMGVTLLLVTMGVIQVSRYYQQAQTKTALLNANRELHQKFAQDLQYSGYVPLGTTASPLTKSGYNIACVGTTRYIWKANSFTDNFFGTDTITSEGQCTTNNIDTTVTSSPMPPNTRVTKFELTQVNGFYQLTTRFIAANNTDLFTGNDYTKDCIGVAFGGSFCATGQLSSTLVRKVQ